MTDRDRLIELIEGAENQRMALVLCCTVEELIDVPTREEYVADHLLANGIIAPPVRVGGKVYKINRNKVKECEVVFVGISADEKCSHFNFVENYADGTFYKSYSMVFDVIGKTVFLTKEEAEAKLKEREGNG